MHWSFNCKGEPYKTYGVEDWDIPGQAFFTSNGDLVSEKATGFKIHPFQPINTSVFEEAEVIND
jgi:hypothetical protein